MVLMDLNRLVVPRETATWILDNLRASLSSDLNQRQAARAGLEKALNNAIREGENLLSLRLRDQIDDETYEQKRKEILERQARLKLQLEHPAESPQALLEHLERALQFTASAPEAFLQGDSVQRRQILHAVTSNWKVQDGKAVYLAKRPFSFLARRHQNQRGQAIVEELRTWLVRTTDLFLPHLKLETEHVRSVTEKATAG
jgi:hypothetical protein